MRKRRPKDSPSLWEEKAWKAMSLWVRKKYADKNGIVACYTCPRFGTYKEMDAGHYVSRRYKSTKFDERNVKPQCVYCNQHLKGASDEFALHLIQDYGQEILAELRSLKNKICKRTWVELKDIYERYAEIGKKNGE